MSLPKLWCIKPSDELKDWMMTWEKENRKSMNVAFTYGSCYYYLKVSDNFKSWDYRESMPTGYTEITFEQFKKYVIKQTPGKLIGYKFKPEFKRLEQSVANMLAITTASWERNLSLDGWAFMPNSQNAIDLREAGVLDVWFDKVYEEDKPKTIEFQMGDPLQKIVVSKDSITGDGKTINIEVLNKLKGVMKPDNNFGAKWDVIFPNVKLGCTTFTMDEVDQVLKAHRNLNR